LKNAGANTVRLGTSSDNIAMQKLARELGFICVSEELWFSKSVSSRHQRVTQTVGQ